MAYSVDKSNFADLDELIDSDEITEKFTKAADHLKTLVSKTDNDTLLTLYGYYKQGSEGPCNINKPNWYDTKGKAKWEAWKKLGDMSQNEAKASYIQLIQNIDPNFTITSTSKEPGWVSVSTLQSSTEPPLNDTEKCLADYIKEGNNQLVSKTLKSYKQRELNNIINKLDDEGLGLIHWAADRGSPEILKTLIEFGADVNLVDSNMQTALHYAASCSHVDCIKILLNNNADVNVKDDDDLKPIEVADNDVIKELLSNYA